MDEFEQIAADLEKSIKIDETAAPLSAEAQELLKDPANVRKALALGAAVLAKAKGAQPTDLKQEKAVKDEDVTDTEDDPAEEPVKSGKGYKDTRPYVGKMGKGEDGDDDDDGDGDGKPSFFGKKKDKMAKKGHKVKKSEESDEGSEDGDLVEVTDAIDELGKAVNWLVDNVHELRKSQDHLTDGSAVFGQVLSQIAENDPRRDTLVVNMAKALSFIVGEVKDLKKSFSEHRDLMKAVAEMPGAPRVAGLALIKAEAESGDAGSGVAGTPVSKGDKERLFKAAVQKSITKDEYHHALKTGDTSVLAKVAK